MKTAKEVFEKVESMNLSPFGQAMHLAFYAKGVSSEFDCMDLCTKATELCAGLSIQDQRSVNERIGEAQRHHVIQ